MLYENDLEIVPEIRKLESVSVCKSGVAENASGKVPLILFPFAESISSLDERALGNVPLIWQRCRVQYCKAVQLLSNCRSKTKASLLSIAKVSNRLANR